MPTAPKDALLKRYRLQDNLPRHVAIIMDGNGRWAQKRHLPRIAGHRAGAHSIREIVRTSGELGLEALTLYAFSTENWKRPATEVRLLMALLRQYLKSEVPELIRNNVQLRTIGNSGDLPREIQRELKNSIQRTSHCTGLKLVLALSYSGRADLARAARSLAEQVLKKKLRPQAINEKALSGALSTRDLPEVDLLVRTSGEMRVSNFLLWELAYSEFHITKTLWPDFRTPHLMEALRDFQGRQRRFGGVENITGSVTSWAR
ncbi:MAG TPA: isoprenyl transferase [bacterium]|nr:isoprenyl transferase [bacterium]